MVSKKDVIAKYRAIVELGDKAAETSAKYALGMREVPDQEFLRNRSNIENHQSMLIIGFAQAVRDLDFILDYLEENNDH